MINMEDAEEEAMMGASLADAKGPSLD